MPQTSPAPVALEREFLLMRCKVLEIASALDRIDRGEGDVGVDPRMLKLRDALRTLLTDSPNRAEQIQLIFSDEFDPTWFEKFTPTR